MLIYAISDIHGCYESLIETMKQIDLSCDNKLILLGDYIDRGPNSFQVLEYVYNLQKEYPNQVIALKGNHEYYIEEWIKKDVPLHLGMDIVKTIKSFFNSEDEYLEFSKDFEKLDRLEMEERIKKYIIKNHNTLLTWIINLPFYYETEKQIFVHAGIDEEADDLWKIGTPDYMFVEKTPATFGKFYKDIIAGHISTASITNDEYYHKVYYDGFSHYYIDGETISSGFIPILIYDTKTDTYIFN